jgi:lipid A ethanolaminephosphotransferase
MHLFHRSSPPGEGHNPLTLAWLGAAWMGLFANWPLWQTLLALPEMATWRGRLFVLAFCVMVTALTAFVLSIAAWRWTIKPVLAVFLLAAAAGAHFMGTYRAVIDTTMMVNVLQTDVRETRDLLGWRLAASLGLLAGLPLVWLWRTRLQAVPPWRQLRHNLLGMLAAFALMSALLLGFFADMSATMRNHKPVRYLINPLNSFYALAMVGVEAQAVPSGPPVVVGADARIVPPAGGGKPPLVVVVVGETARADHFSLNGYARPTNPRLAGLDVLSLADVTSCGTSTATSLPCMFSLFGKSSFEAEKTPHENVLDVLQRAGLAVLWLDNQAGCKGLCDRVPHAFANEPATGAKALPAGLCSPDGECLDEALLHGLSERVSALPPERRARGIVLVLHQMGSHGPAYWKRSPGDRKPFKPECETNVLQQCERAALVNAYDNSIVYTDEVLARAIGWLKEQASTHEPTMLYVSDHGESLGENNLYLHGLPYSFAPREQKHVPWVMWLPPSAGDGQRAACLAGRRSMPVTHDHLSHTLLGLARVETSAYRADRDLLAACRTR